MGSEDYEFEYIEAVTGKLPAIRGFDYMNDDFDGVNERAVKWANKGGIVTICHHCGTEYTGGWTEAMNGEIENWDALLTEGTPEYDKMIEGIDKAAKALKELENAGVTVLWRPYHEFDGGWFWWGKGGAESFKKLWEIMYKRYTDYWQLNNLIWVLGFSHNGVDMKAWLPSCKYYDVIGADSYDKEELPLLYKNVFLMNKFRKPIVLHECGANPNLKELKNYPWGWFLTWHTEYMTDTNAPEELNELYNSEKIITLDEIKY